MKKILLIAGALWFSFGAAIAQSDRCGTMAHHERMKALDPGYESRLNGIEQLIQQRMKTDNSWRTTNVVIIPVVFHILYSTNNTTQNISTARIMAQLDVLNQDYSATNTDITSVPSVFQSAIGNVGIQFCLAVQDPAGNSTTGIIRKQTSTTSFSQNDAIKFNSQGGDDAWPSSSYLNIWVGNLSNNLLGYAQFPGGIAATDGVVLRNGTVGGPGALGTTPKYNRGRTATHEIGHWLNLRHINGDAACGNDFVNDTPSCSALSYDCPVFPLISCGNAPNGAMFMNYMDYTDDVCMYMFTAGQGTRMNYALTVARPGLLSSLGCVPVTVGVNEHANTGISIQPNPTQGLITINNSNTTLETANIRVINTIGQTVSKTDFSNFIGSNQVDLSALPDGIYFIEVKTKSSNSVHRIILDK